MGRGSPSEAAPEASQATAPEVAPIQMIVDAIIPARGGSKGIPRKNVRSLGGVPLLEWIVTAALHAHLDHVLVSTDDPEIANVASRCGALVLMRPAELAGDDVGDHPVLRHALQCLGGRPQIVVHLRPTSPFVAPVEINEVVRVLETTPALTSVRSVRTVPGHPRKMYREDLPVERWPTIRPYTGSQHAANSPRQGLEPVWLAAGFVDAFRPGYVLFGGDLEGPTIGRWIAPESRAVDLDTEHDWVQAETMIAAHGWHPGHPFRAW